MLHDQPRYTQLLRAFTYRALVEASPNKAAVTHFRPFSSRTLSLFLPHPAVNTATFSVFADDFTITNMVVLNSAPRPPPAVVGGQAVAFMSTANRTLAYNCTFRSFQVKGWGRVLREIKGRRGRQKRKGERVPAAPFAVVTRGQVHTLISQ